jgi:hypothetical protein
VKNWGYLGTGILSFCLCVGLPNEIFLWYHSTTVWSTFLISHVHDKCLPSHIYWCSYPNNTKIRFLLNFILFIPCIVDNQFTTLKPTKCTILWYCNINIWGTVLCVCWPESCELIFLEIQGIILFIQTYSVIWWQTFEICTWNLSVSCIVFSYYEVCNSASRLTSFELDCNATCNCDRNKFSPICGRDKNTYFSACHAGCQNMTLVGGKVVSVRFSTVFIGNVCVCVCVFQCMLILGFTKDMLSWERIYITEHSLKAMIRNKSDIIRACTYVRKWCTERVNVDVCVCACTCFVVHWACIFMWSNVNYMEVKSHKF